MPFFSIEYMENMQNLSGGSKPGTYRKKMFIATEIPKENEESNDVSLRII
jgi:hypothetical protein